MIFIDQLNSKNERICEVSTSTSMSTSRYTLDMIGSLVRSLMSLVNTKKDNIKFEKKTHTEEGKKGKLQLKLNTPSAPLDSDLHI